MPCASVLHRRRGRTAVHAMYLYCCCCIHVDYHHVIVFGVKKYGALSSLSPPVSDSTYIQQYSSQCSYRSLITFFT